MLITPELTLVHARLEEVLGQAEWLRLIFTSLLADQSSQLFLQQVTNDGEGIHGHLLVGNIGVLNVAAARKVVEVIARLNG